jgi:uncharacterized OB-fold protein
MRICPDCHASVDDAAKFCDNCGFHFEPAAPVNNVSNSQAAPAQPAAAWQATPGVASGTCSTCGYVNIPGEMFCQNCGVQLAPVASVPPPPPRPIPGTPPVEEKQSVVEKPAEAAPPQAVAPVEPAQAAGHICPVCGFANDPKDVYCQNCGSQLAESVVTPPAPAAAPFSAANVQAVGEAEQPDTSPSLSAQRASLGYAPMSAAPPGMGKFVVRDTGAVVLLPAGRNELILGRTDPVRNIFPDVDLTPYGGEKGGVSRIHARLILEGRQLYLEDLNSTNFTFLNKQRIYPGQRYALKQGDEVRVGLLTLEYWAE